MKHHESFTSHEQLDPAEAALKQHQDKLIGYFLSGGDDRYIFNSNEPAFSSSNITDGEREAVLNKIQSSPNGYRKLERQLLDQIARSRHPETPGEIFDKINTDKHQKKILAYMTGTSWHHLDEVSGHNIAAFLADYPNPIDFESASAEFMEKISEHSTLDKCREYQESMQDFCRQVYGKKYEYYEAMKELHREAFAERAEERAHHQGTGKQTFWAIFGPKNT